MTQAAVEFVNVTKTYGSHHAVKELNLTLESGKLTTLIGPSGCGKTTTLKMINRLIEPSSGKLLVAGQDIANLNPVELRRNIGYVIQQIGLFPHMTIEENITLVPRLKGRVTNQLRQRTEELLDLIGLDPSVYRHRYPRELSGGQQQRIGVARALAADPQLILMDEPFSALDPISREQLQDELIKLQETVQKTIVFVTHDMDEALKIADQIVLMKDGSIVQVASPEQLLRHPKDDFVREFVGEKRFQSAALQSAKDALTTAVTVRPTRGLAEAVNLMRRHRVDGLIVTDREGKFLGVVATPEIYENYGNESARVTDVMRADVPIVREETPIREVFQHMQNTGRGFLPVIAKDDRLVGVVTRASILNAMANPYEQEGVK
ncbi:ABC transporter ATP-binding protein [Alicyclobacillus shizuokensis]|uniref:ABC transporter ATP-binding protein n=1 Tax=Alicyclobacillus shizuokensis TaxID=392014 RepID=UPI0008324DE6|nr:betaine/proline/choline family ABC transporter ATP-binding protein [Alicyclobacillus shizuokensis]MCL6625776.1 betaine/proline/choline family ABC transporter ATP-binding protein [Alicyclobacillus shizuokensis]